MRPKGSADLLSDGRGRALKLVGEKLSLNELAHRLCSKFRYVLAESLVATRRRSPQGGILCRSSEKTRATLRVPAGQDPTQGRHRQWLPHRIVDDGGDSQDLPRAVPVQTPLANSCSWFQSIHRKPERRALERDEEAIRERGKRKDWLRVKKTSGWRPI